MNPLTMVANAAVRRLDVMFPGFFADAKHNHYRDFGFPATLDFRQLHGMYLRNGIARAGVDKTVRKTWQDTPYLLEKERDGSERGTKKETTLERTIRQTFDDLRLWDRLRDADRRSMVGGYSAAILALRDSKRWEDPVDTVPGGLEGLGRIIPAWAGQLTVGEWDTDPMSETYGDPKMYQFTESAVDEGKANARQFLVHPDRVLIWSDDGSVHARSILEPGYNDLMTLEKISGAGGEGFWKNAKSAPVLSVDKDAKVAEMAKAMGVPVEEVADKMGEQVADWQKGFDQLLMLQGIDAKTLGIVLPSPEHFFNIALQSFAASIGCPLKILVGNQTGERASTEDANEWNQTNMSRRTGQIVPSVMTLVRRLERFNILPQMDWYLDWTDLSEASMGEKIDRAGKMAEVNFKMKETGEFIWTPEEIRATVGYEPLSEADKTRDDTSEEDEAAAVTPPAAAIAEDDA